MTVRQVIIPLTQRYTALSPRGGVPASVANGGEVERSLLETLPEDLGWQLTKIKECSAKTPDFEVSTGCGCKFYMELKTIQPNPSEEARAKESEELGIYTTEAGRLSNRFLNPARKANEQLGKAPDQSMPRVLLLADARHPLVGEQTLRELLETFIYGTPCAVLRGGWYFQPPTHRKTGVGNSLANIDFFFFIEREGAGKGRLMSYRNPYSSRQVGLPIKGLEHWDKDEKEFAIWYEGVHGRPVTGNFLDFFNGGVYGTTR